MTCTCAICNDIAIFNSHLEKIPPEQRAYFEELYDRFLDRDADLDYTRSILTGELPSAGVVLTAALEKWKEKHEKQITNEHLKIRVTQGWSTDTTMSLQKA